MRRRAMQKCPGQDTQRWKPSDVSEVRCAGCGYAVEFFKTDGLRRCPKCGTRVVNPRVSLGCAAWCSHADTCVGPDALLAALKTAPGGKRKDAAGANAEGDESGRSGPR